MAISHVDFAIATGVFLLFIGFLFGHLTGYLTNYKNLAETSELREMASTLFNVFFIGKGIPSNWEEQNLTPVKVGLMNNLYLITINVTEINGSYMNDITINGTIDFDPDCSRNVLNNTLRLYNLSNYQIPFQLYNQSFCDDNFLKKGEIVFNVTLEPYQSKFFYLYFSSEKSVVQANYSLEFPINETNYTFETFPVQEFQIISVDKMRALRNLSYEEVIGIVSKDYNFRVEIA